MDQQLKNWGRLLFGQIQLAHHADELGSCNHEIAAEVLLPESVKF